MDRVVLVLRQNPYVGSPYRGHYRKYVLDRFPYNMFYYVADDGAVTIVALAHHSRKPDYWIDRNS